MATLRRISDSDALLVLKKWLEKCWDLDIDWTLYPSFLQKVCFVFIYSVSYIAT